MPVRALLALMVLSVATPALALQPQDTLRDWSAASAAERDRLLQQLETSGGGASSKEAMSCLNDAAGMDAHAALTIRDVFTACTKQTSKNSI